jgi:hypothetical protein
MLFFCSAQANSLVDASIARPRSTCSSRHSKGEQENLAILIMLGTAFITGVLFEGSPSRSLQMLMFGYLVHEDVISEQKLKSERKPQQTPICFEALRFYAKLRLIGKKSWIIWKKKPLAHGWIVLFAFYSDVLF